jgi:hypothetical protein
MNCEVRGCELRSYVHYLATGLHLCRWHSYLFRKAAESNDEPTCQRLLNQLPANKRRAEEQERVKTTGQNAPKLC